MPVFERQLSLPVDAQSAFAWHERPGALQRLTPPWEPVRVLRQSGHIRDGAQVELEISIGPLRQRWLAEHRGYEFGKQFQDFQVSGPFRKFEHTHRFADGAQGGSTLTDHIEYEPPLGAVGGLFGGGIIASKLERMFRYRHAVTAHDLAQWQQLSESPRRTIAVTGANGAVGSSLIPLLTTAGHKVLRLVRTAREPGDVVWNPQAGKFAEDALQSASAVVHLAGESIAGRRWSDDYKRRIRDSRVVVTRQLCETLAQLPTRPDVLVCASAQGFYGDRGEEVLTEASLPGSGFLPEVCQAWEAACEPAVKAGIRVVHARLGVILTPNSGALAQMRPIFQTGLAGPLGSGRQYMSWVAMDDVLGAIDFAIQNNHVVGPINVTGPQPVTNREFTQALARCLWRPAVLPAPKFALKLALGAMAEDLLLASTRAMPERLQQSGYRFRCETVESALRHVLGR
jgi:uncharacterized protein